MFKPKGFFVTGGVGISDISSLNAFDNALKDAGLADYNLVPVSSIIPRDAAEVKPMEFEKGTIVFLVLAVCRGFSGDHVRAGVAWARAEEDLMGIVMEYSEKGDALTEARTELERRLSEAFAVRGLKAGEVKTHLESLGVPEGSFGCVVAAVVFTSL